MHPLRVSHGGKNNCKILYLPREQMVVLQEKGATHDTH